MADLSDVTAYLKSQAISAVYPNGTLQPSIVGLDCLVVEGWPNAAKLDLDVAGMTLDNSRKPPLEVQRPNGPRMNVSVFPMAGTGVSTYQIQDETRIISQPTYGITFVVIGDVIYASGQPGPGEYLTVEADRQFIYSATGATLPAILSTLATQAQANYPTASSTATSLSIPAKFSFSVRQGGVGVMGKVTWRQKHCVMVSVWADTPDHRTTLASAVDNLIKQNLKVSMPDTSQAVIRYSRTNVIDEGEARTVYRRDLIYEAEYATLEEFPGYVVTSVTIDIANPSNTAIATAIV
ncbi:hypothetical protein [Bradyrhizobium sp. Tv2a-2]|uniref:hypothetical protein n=1 Tax=Bradyrhizobium sp. Tv2a-2 TaxID=113395 RepID=UPI00041AE3A0|nr:hypothetical protein [Bradyrhizobium sp. Tv2a-2]